MGIGLRIRKARVEAGLEQSQLAEAVGVASNTVWRWESGQSSPRGDVIERVATALGKSVGWLYGDETPDADLATEARLLRERLEHLERAAQPDVEPSAVPVDALRAHGVELTAAEVAWLRSYDGAPCETLEDAVDLLLLWRTWELKRRLRQID